MTFKYLSVFEEMHDEDCSAQTQAVGHKASIKVYFAFAFQTARKKYVMNPNV